MSGHTDSPLTHSHPAPETPAATAPRRWAAFWRAILLSGLGEYALRLGTHLLLLGLIFVLAWGLRQFYQRGGMVNGAATPALGEGNPPAGSTAKELALPSLPQVALQPWTPSQKAVSSRGVVRLADLHTEVPSSRREGVVEYLVKEGDTITSIAEQFGLQPQTILWANQPVLGDNPHNLRPGQRLNILPVDGAYHRWVAGESLQAVANFYGVSVEAILSSPANQLDPVQFQASGDPGVEAGTWLVIPGGRRNFVAWSAPFIPLDNLSLGKVLGSGACEEASASVAGSGVFIWPTTHRYLGGYGYEPAANHPALDIFGNEGDPVYAADSGVVVYAGWNNWGYGNVVVINHNNGWQTLYAHLSAFYVSCGQNVLQGDVIAAVGQSGNVTLPQLHFELMYLGDRVNPYDYLR